MNLSLKPISILTLLLLNCLFQQGLSQTWTTPVNISPNMPGLDNQPDLCIDKNGTLHCVFTHKLDNNWRKIYYSKSLDDGATWSIPEDISLNPDTSLMNPHIVADTNNNLYVAYDYNTGNPAMTMIHLRTFDGNQWSNPYVVSEGYYNSDLNQLEIDNNNRLYVFWIFENQLTYYRSLENETWGNITCPYPGNHIWGIISLKHDEFNNLHCTGVHLNPGQSYTEIKVIYFQYIYEEDYWTDKTIISPETILGEGSVGLDIDLNNYNWPQITYRQKTYGTGPDADSTMYSFFNGNFWTEPELVVNDPYEQQIAIDVFNRTHILDREKQNGGYKLVHYQKFGDLWQGTIIDTADFFIVFYTLMKSIDKLHIAYYRTDVEGEGDIFFSSYDIITSAREYVNKNLLKNIVIYPNPFSNQTTIEYDISQEKEINISVYNLNGQHIKTIYNRITQPGRYQQIWNGKDKNRKELKNGLYLVRLQWGRNFVTKPVEYIK